MRSCHGNNPIQCYKTRRFPKLGVPFEPLKSSLDTLSKLMKSLSKLLSCISTLTPDFKEFADWVQLGLDFLAGAENSGRVERKWDVSKIILMARRLLVLESDPMKALMEKSVARVRK
jgi:hypothetical protein